MALEEAKAAQADVPGMATQDIAELVQLKVATKLENERLRAVALPMRTNRELDK